ncbi:TetR/AcrR family transcriptional regulator [Hoeflea sp.]|uniref:TetR/AcrR family transcriptional regulator n=1 Tax=Hoeflea sp. TaxID=1940281 RepID=UPI0025C27EEA|nr:TetR/AcrR family transcriptional regulator [Hoeflea sp.]
MAKSQRQTRINGEITRSKILDAAETLFGTRGFDAVSLREITERAEVTLALASYHFGTKEQLFEDVIARRAAILCGQRIERLEALADPDVETIIDSFMSPMFEMATSGEPGWNDYFKLLSRLGDGNQWLDVLTRHFDATAKRYIAVLIEAMPNAKPGDVVRAFTMMLNLMLATVSQHARIDRLTDGELKAADLTSAYKPLLKFVVAGMKSINP